MNDWLLICLSVSSYVPVYSIIGLCWQQHTYGWIDGCVRVCVCVCVCVYVCMVVYVCMFVCVCNIYWTVVQSLQPKYNACLDRAEELRILLRQNMMNSSVMTSSAVSNQTNRLFELLLERAKSLVRSFFFFFSFFSVLDFFLLLLSFFFFLFFFF